MESYIVINKKLSMLNTMKIQKYQSIIRDIIRIPHRFSRFLCKKQCVILCTIAFHVRDIEQFAFAS